MSAAFGSVIPVNLNNVNSKAYFELFSISKTNKTISTIFNIMFRQIGKKLRKNTEKVNSNNKISQMFTKLLTSITP